MPLSEKTSERPDEFRYQAEKEFHDRWAREVDFDHLIPHRVFNCPVIPESRYSIECLGGLKGKRVLDLGCGYGETSVYLALQGAKVDAVDISPEMTRLTQALARKYWVEDAVAASVQNAEELSFEEDRFDLVYGQDVLHHTKLERSLPEIYRVLKKGGRGCFCEPLGHNVIINFFRQLSPEVRTEDEHPLRMKDIERFSTKFQYVRHLEFHLFTLALFFWFQLLDLLQRKKGGRPWKRIIEESHRYRWSFQILFGLDKCLFTLFPFMKRYCRMTVISFSK